jgi:thymidylate kinase
MVVESLPAATKPASLLRDGWLQPDRGFAAVQDDDTTHFIHVGTGFMSPAQSPDELAQFICMTLAGLHPGNDTRRSGAFVVLLGLDGSGKTTLARNLTVLATNEKNVSGVRYFHWLPPLGERFEFPLPEPGNQPRQTEQAGGIAQSLVSVARLARNVLRAQLAWWIRLKPLCKKGQLVLVDRYYYNYHLDPVSVKYHGPRWLLALAGALFPKPDIVITLSAPPEVLLARKQELSGKQIREQAASLANLNFGHAHVIKADATEQPDVVARKVMDEIVLALSQKM